MNVQSSARRRAVLGIYGAHRKPRGSGFVLRQLETEWRETGLRRFDLQLALKDMVKRQWLRLLFDADNQPHYELTFLGECAVHMALAGGPLTMVNDWMTLRHAKFRQHHQTANTWGPRNRRASDHIILGHAQPRALPDDWTAPQL